MEHSPFGLRCPPSSTALSLQHGSYGRISEVCRRYGLSRSGIYRLASAGEITFVKLGTSTLVDLYSLEAFMAALPKAVLRPASAKVIGQAATEAK
jgi:excisionase family DNA binding protein